MNPLSPKSASSARITLFASEDDPIKIRTFFSMDSCSSLLCGTLAAPEQSQMYSLLRKPNGKLEQRRPEILNFDTDNFLFQIEFLEIGTASGV
jgi:hypothetical protein